MAAIYVITMVAMMSLLLTSPPCEAWTKDIKVKYYASTILRCDEKQTTIADTDQVFWITPDAKLIQENPAAGNLPQNVRLVNDSVISMLNVTKINDAMFGYYTCVMIRTNGSVDLARWGLNVNGADFSDLEEEYRRNAVIGAIAAAVMIILVGGACVVWHFRYSKRLRNGETPSIEDDLKKTSNVYDNRAYDDPCSTGQMEMVETTDDKMNGSPSSSANAAAAVVSSASGVGGSEKRGGDSYRM